MADLRTFAEAKALPMPSRLPRNISRLSATPSRGSGRAQVPWC